MQAEDTETKTKPVDQPAAAFTAQIRIATLEDALRPIMAMAYEARFQVTKAGLACVTVDPAHVALAKVELDRNAFEKLQVETEGFFIAEVDELYGALRRASQFPDVYAWLTVDKEHLLLQYGRHSYRADLEEMAIDWPSVPNLDKLPVTLSVARLDYRRALEIMNHLSDHVRQTVSAAEGFELFAQDNDHHHSWRAVWPENEAIVSLTGPANSLHPLDYLLNIVKSAPRDCTHIALKLGVDYPITLSWPILQKQRTVGGVLCMLAPRIESE